MNRLLVSAAVLGLISSAPALAQGAPASTTAQATADIVGVISIEKSTDMDFGQLVAPTTETHVTVAADGTLAGGLAVPSGSSGSAASFTVTGSEYNYSATVPASISLASSGLPSMNLDLTVVGGAANRTGLVGDSTDDLVITGDLTVGANQPIGSYSGTINVSVAYD